MNRLFKKSMSFFICMGVLATGLFPIGNQRAYAQKNILSQTTSGIDVWVQNSADKAFDSSEKPRYAANKIDLFSAKKESKQRAENFGTIPA